MERMLLVDSYQFKPQRNRTQIYLSFVRIIAGSDSHNGKCLCCCQDMCIESIDV